MTNIAKILTVAVTLVVGTGAISGIALANTNPFYPELENPNVSVPSFTTGSGIPATYRIGNRVDEQKVSVPQSGVGSGIPSQYR